ncbi:PKD domain-containing protein [Marinobacteraceae bacterium S3BR75-40.1]
MIHPNVVRFSVVATLLLVVVACGGGSSGGGNSAPVNSSPIANAGFDQDATVGASVELEGSESSDADGDTLTYSWALTSKPIGSSAALTSHKSQSPTFVPDVAGEYVASLTVSDGKQESATAMVTIEAVPSNSAPVANAGAALSVIVDMEVQLDGSKSSDADADRLTYSWALISKPSNSSAALTSPTSVSPTFVADVPGAYVASLIVNDGDLNSTASTVTVEAASGNAAPVANAGSAQSVLVGTTVELDGSTSSDANDDTLTYFWELESKPAQSSTALISNTSVSPTFFADVAGSFILSLRVNDGKVDSLIDTTEVTAVLEDTAGPAVSSISVNPSTVDVSQISQTVTAIVVVSDATGVDLNRLPSPYWYNVDDLQGTRINDTWELTAGDSEEATLRSEVSIPAGAKPGEWIVGSTAFHDVLGYSSTNGGYSQSFTVQNSSAEDTSGPTVSAITVSPLTVDVSQASQTVTATVVVSDATGVDLNRLPSPYWYNVDDLQGTRINDTWELTAGDSEEATLRSEVSIPAGAKPGEWIIGCIAFYDVLGYSSTNGGYSESFTVE